MNFQGAVIGLAAFVVIGIFHPIVIKAEYYLGKKIWPVFLIAGFAFVGASVLVKNPVASAILGIIGFSCLWSIRELFQQEERVQKGWFPKNENRVQKASSKQQHL